MNGALHAPEPLSATHVTAQFSCGEVALDDWLKRRALPNQVSGASRVFVVTDDTGCVRAYYALAAGAVARETSPGSIRRNMPEPIPVIVLGRLAVDRQAQGCHLGAGILKDAVQRAAMVATEIGVRALLVHALNETARQFYLRYGFAESPIDRMTLMLRLTASLHGGKSS